METLHILVFRLTFFGILFKYERHNINTNKLLASLHKVTMKHGTLQNTFFLKISS